MYIFTCNRKAVFYRVLFQGLFKQSKVLKRSQSLKMFWHPSTCKHQFWRGHNCKAKTWFGRGLGPGGLGSIVLYESGPQRPNLLINLNHPYEILKILSLTTEINFHSNAVHPVYITRKYFQKNSFIFCLFHFFIFLCKFIPI